MSSGSKSVNILLKIANPGTPSHALKILYIVEMNNRIIIILFLLFGLLFLQMIKKQRKKEEDITENIFHLIYIGGPCVIVLIKDPTI
jgi:Ca2+/Na+ antiporter